MTDTLTAGSEITDLASVPFGTRVSVTQHGNRYAGTVHGRLNNTGVGNPPTHLWVTDPSLPTDDDLFAYSQGEPYRSSDRTWDEAGAWNNVPGYWFGPSNGATIYVAEPEPERASEDERSHLQALDTITALRAEVSDLQSQVQVARGVIEQIGSALKETADQSEWCGEYERRVEALYGALPGRYGFDSTFRDAAIREREYEVCVHWTVTYSTTVTVEASSQDAAVEMVADSPRDWVDPFSSSYSDDVSWDEIHSGD